MTGVSLLGKTVNQLQSGIIIGNSGISGTLNYVTGYTGFSSDASEQSGNYLALHATADGEAVITAELVGDTPVILDDDGIMIFRITSTSQIVRVTASQASTVITKEYSLTGLTLES